MLRIFIDFILKTALEWRVNLTVLRSKFKRIRPVWFLSCSDEVSIIAIMKPEECCRPQSRFFFVHSPSCCQRIDRKLCSDLRFLSEVSRSAGWRALIWVYICVFFVKYLCSREIPRCKKNNRVWGLIDKGKLNCTSNITACQLPAFHREFRIGRQDGIMLW